MGLYGPFGNCIESIESNPCHKRKPPVHAQTVTRGKYQTATYKMKHPNKGISVFILIPDGIVFEATARVAPEKQTESLPADALFT